MAKKPTGHLTRRTLLATAGKATVVAMAAPFVDLASGEQTAVAQAPMPPLNVIAGRHICWAAHVESPPPTKVSELVQLAFGTVKLGAASLIA